MSDKPFYNHIAGLRGLAIILVILFHLNAAYFPHGFYGVDIFLTISGYLLFLSFNRDGQTLDIRNFITKKLYRILPPLAILVLCTLLAAMYFMDCEDLEDLAKTGRYTLLGYANEHLRKSQSDYFASDSLNNPFLHMWYLAVTIHLYIMFAIGCIAYRYIPKNAAKITLWIIGIGSFCYGYSYYVHNILQALNLPVWEQTQAISHYSTLPRVWEPLAGGAILLLPAGLSRAKSSLLTLAGLILAITPAVLPCSYADYGVPAVVLGTMLIIRYMPQSMLMPVLGNKPLLWIGGISFSLYLVHMPVIAFYRIWYQAIGGWGEYIGLITASLALGYLFWYTVEKRRINLVTTLTVWGLGMVICITGRETDGFKDYLWPEINAIRITPYDEWKFCAPEVLSNKLDLTRLVYNKDTFALAHSTRKVRTPQTPLLQLGPDSTTPSVVLIGDSHAQAAYFGLDRICHEMNISGAFFSGIILPFWDRHHYLSSIYFYNRNSAEALVEWLTANPCVKHVIIAQYWRERFKGPNFTHWDLQTEPMTKEIYLSSLREFIQKIRLAGKEVLLLGPSPEIPNGDPTRYVRTETKKGRVPVDPAPLSCTREEILQKNADILPVLNQLQAEGLCTVLNTLDFLPADKPFNSYQDKVFLMHDDDHLSSDGSTALFQHLRPQLEPILKQK